MKKLKNVSPYMLIILMFINSSLVFCAEIENLDEMMARKLRQNDSTFYSGESGSSYIWQPQTLCYYDENTGHEVWRMTNTPSTKNVYHDDLRWSSWSADGAYLAYSTDMFDSLNYKTEAFDGDGFGVWMTPRTNGAALKPIINGPTRVDEHQPYFIWSPIEPGSYYSFGRTRAGNLDVSNNSLYKGTITDFETTNTFLLDFPGDKELKISRTISGDGQKILATEWAEDNLYPATIHPTASLDDLDGYSISLNIDTYWGDATTPVVSWHGETMSGYAGNYWVYFLENGSHTWWRMRLTGSGDSGAPNHTVDHIVPYSWGGELEPINSAFKGNNPYPDTEYWSHLATDKWGRFAIFSQTEGRVTSPGVEDTTDHTIDYDTYGLGGAQHHDYSSWSDYFVSTKGPKDYNYTDDVIASMKHNAGDESLIHVVYPHTLYNNSGSYVGSTYEYNALPRPFQSPDGSKVGYHSTFLNTKNGLYDNAPDVFWAVVYYPYPPEITECSADSGTVNIKFDWQNTLPDPNPRTYTTRGWPNESVDDRPIPRETNKYRLWRSQNDSDWTPVGTVDAEHFTRFDFANGGFISGQNNYWEITDNPGDGIWYYAVSSIEHSGLESRSLSNSWKVEIADGSIANGEGEGTQETDYPSDPGGVLNFWTTLPSAPSNLVSTELVTPGHYQLTWDEPEDAPSMIRYYNIYYSSTGTPSAIQQNRIASVPVGTNSWLDWLADSSAENGYYKITSVDTQGNEGAGDESLNSDINNDGSINVQDVILCINIILGIEIGNGDVNSDGQTNIQDVTTIINEIL